MGSFIKVVLFFYVVIKVSGAGQEDTRPLVNTKYGQLLGKTVNVKDTTKTVHAFMGVPFAKPPVGPLRFVDPQPPEPWSSVREASAHPYMCLQDVEIIKQLAKLAKAVFEIPPVSEDCLYLNVYTPAEREGNSKLPVMVFIHGGGLAIGAASMFDGSALSVYENVVVVSIQYRLGLLGFFSSGDTQARGNFGLLDQVAALQWVQDNIKDFSGDPTLVTIFGESAGGFSVAAHILSPLSKGLFHKAIAQSGVALLPGLMISETKEVLFIRDLVANISGCNVPDLVDCLKQKSEDDIVAISEAMKFGALPGCVDGEFLPKPAEEILAGKESNNVPFMIGVNNHEFGWILPVAINISGLKEGIEKKEIESTLRAFPLLHTVSNIIPLIIEEYFGDTNDPKEIRNIFLELNGDILFVIPALRTAQYHRDTRLPVYFYEFQHRPSMFHDSKPDFVKADHGDELFFVFGGPFLSADVIFQSAGTEEEKVLSKRIMRYWANFARTGDPNGPGLSDWPKYGEDEDYLEINLNQKPSHKLKEGRLKFWTTTVPEKITEMMDERKDHTEL
ncbi:hypothetical protein GDO86_008202 [Hymenochirus boettgeri]|uniref:Carboxylesterase type B domain-containing protein n=1 Tax=Hymenochirus boettgeri TaxID=247094 RepID=A0A8T2IZJ0_9PIPI|nr:hypothetical protein GDO86_008202 [Hymenochirus boettgeri]